MPASAPAITPPDAAPAAPCPTNQNMIGGPPPLPLLLAFRCGAGCLRLVIPTTMRSQFPKMASARRNGMSGNVTEVLAGFAASLQYDDIPARTRDHCKNVLLDTLACAVAGHRGEETQQLAALASGLAQSDESSVIGGDRLSLAGAALLNGYLVTPVTMCDVHRPAPPPATPPATPP